MASALSTITKNICQQLLGNRSVLWINGLTLVLFLVLLTHAKVWGSPQEIEFLFHKADPTKQPHLGFLTLISNVLWGLPVAYCAFSLGLMKQIHPQGRLDRFLLLSATGISIILIDEVYRITISLVTWFGVSKVLIASLYGVAALGYIFSFRKRIHSTPYALLLAAISLVVISRVVDLLRIAAPGAPARMLLEDGTKLLGLVNLTLYWWLVCQQEVLRSLQRYRQPTSVNAHQHL
ncbi:MULTISPECIES: hypothetical protein [Trichocoleus]|uniref:Uncharacterized protein n=1 Tax=Trichocoleus desertorum GB2-A4 TaxID=2933944 RepID=A0ABV0J411_9CYAN|nr:hypothetical protein [Trichocoleus sp. FACHB-46]MBD1860597.1 hypothetical protein [Trichocoleus sp. FACHB-46]